MIEKLTWKKTSSLSVLVSPSRKISRLICLPDLIFKEEYLKKLKEYGILQNYYGGTSLGRIFITSAFVLALQVQSISNTSSFKFLVYISD